jgi:hypothetical protein
MFAEWDLGLEGAAVLLLYAVGFGVFTELLLWRYTGWWVGFIAAAAYFVTGLLISEWWFGWATAEELQPNIDGLSRDETLLAWIPGIIVVLVMRHRARRHELDSQFTRHGRAAHA